jgi:hypothetical protein
MLMSYGLKFGIVQHTLLIVNDIELKFIFIFIELLVQVEISVKKESLLGWKFTNIIGGSIYKL